MAQCNKQAMGMQVALRERHTDSRLRVREGNPLTGSVGWIYTPQPGAQLPILGANSSNAVSTAPSNAAATISHQTVLPFREVNESLCGGAIWMVWTAVTGRIVWVECVVLGNGVLS
jgi:hypothetical protein